MEISKFKLEKFIRKQKMVKMNQNGMKFKICMLARYCLNKLWSVKAIYLFMKNKIEDFIYFLEFKKYLFC